jgi:hypothetical protein
MTIYYLYIKTHKITGLKYLGKTSEDPFKYKGSGIDWKQHLKEHGTDHITEVIFQTNDWEQFKQVGRYYSQLYHIVTAVDDFGNKIWANRIPETGGGGSCSEQTREILRQHQLGRSKPPRTKEHKRNLSKSSKGKPKTRTSEHQESLTNSIKHNWSNNNDRKLKTAAVGKSNKGKKHTPETLEKKRQSMIRYWEIRKSLVV